MQFQNAESPMDVTLSGIEIEVSAEQKASILEPIDVTLLGRLIEVSAVQ